MDIIGIVVWVILICGVAALCFWLARLRRLTSTGPSAS